MVLRACVLWVALPLLVLPVAGQVALTLPPRPGRAFADYAVTDLAGMARIAIPTRPQVIPLGHWRGEGFRERAIPLATSRCYEVGKRWWGTGGLQVFVGVMAEPTLNLANPYRQQVLR
ncbi:MAG: hypothetical protein SFY70_05345 [Bacteroidia bacterium]|nr:hypothetical protein [Bacteroidia bacterium]